MRATLAEVLAEAGAAGRAVGAFTCYDATTAAAVLAAAEDAGVPVVLLIAPASMAREHGAALARALVALADAASVPACVQLDHATDLEVVRAAGACGVGAVLADGSRLALEDNVALARQARALVNGAGAGLEVELGHVAGDEDVASAAARGALTEPAEAAAFVAATGADCLAVSIGNVHGRYAAPPDLDWARLAAIRDVVDVPLALHGASGLPAADVRRAIAGGVRKVNVNTEIRAAQLARVARDVGGLLAGAALLRLVDALYEEARRVVAAKLELLNAGGAG